MKITGDVSPCNSSSFIDRGLGEHQKFMFQGKAGQVYGRDAYNELLNRQATNRLRSPEQKLSRKLLVDEQLQGR